MIFRDTAETRYRPSRTSSTSGCIWDLDHSSIETNSSSATANWPTSTNMGDRAAKIACFVLSVARGMTYLGYGLPLIHPLG